MKVYLDAGHGTPTDPGATYNGRRECDDTLRLVNVLNAKFKAQGWQTVLARTNNAGKKLAERTAEANAQKCDIYLSVHRNSMLPTPTANGVEIWLHSKAPQTYKDWAADILKDWSALGFKNRGVKLGYAGGAGEYAVNRDTNMPSMLLEIGFISNTNDNKLFDTHLNVICDSIVKRCCEFVKAPYSSGVQTTQPTTNTPSTPAQTPSTPQSAAKKYRVQTTIYWNNKSYAEAYAKKLSDLKIDGVSFKVVEE